MLDGWRNSTGTEVPLRTKSEKLLNIAKSSTTCVSTGSATIDESMSLRPKIFGHSRAVLGWKLSRNLFGRRNMDAGFR